MTDTPPPASVLARVETPSPFLAILDRLVPDTRVWVMVGIFGLAYKILSMIEAKPDLLTNAAFMTVATMVLGGSGLGAVVAFQFGGTKTGSEVMKAQSAAVIASTPPADPTKGQGQ